MRTSFWPPFLLVTLLLSLNSIASTSQPSFNQYLIRQKSSDNLIIRKTHPQNLELELNQHIDLTYFTPNYTLRQKSPTGIIIRAAQSSDQEQLISLDRRVSFEYFKPIYANGYAHLDLGKNPDHFLELELQNDAVWLPACIQGTTQEQILVAYDQQTQTCAGFLIFHLHDPRTLELDLLLVDAPYRGKGIGKKLIYQAIALSKGITSCVVYPLRYANANTLAFYRTIGFVYLGPDRREHRNVYGIKCSDMYLHYRLDVRHE